MNNSLFQNLFFKTGLTVLALLFTSNPVATADELFVDRPVFEGEIKSAGFIDNSYYEHSGNQFAVEIGDKALDNESIVKFQAEPIKEGGLFSQITRLIGFDSRLGLSFNLINAYDSDATTTAEIQNTKSSFISSFLGKFNSANKSELEDGSLNISKPINDLDIRYSPLKHGLKEEIIINGDKDVFDTYQYQIDLGSDVEIHTATANNIHNLPSGAIYFTDNNDNYFAHFLPLVANDSLGSQTNDISINYIPVGTGLDLSNQYLFTVSVDKGWLLDSARQYPVTIDPTIVHDTQTEFDNGTALNRIEVTTDPYVQIAPDGIDDNTKLMLHMEGENGGTTFVDSSTSQHTVTSNNGASTNSYPRFGDTAGYFDNSNNYLSVPDSDDFYFDGDFTIDYWIYWNSLPGSGDYDVISAQRQDSSNRMVMYWDNRPLGVGNNNNGMGFGWNDGGTWFQVDEDDGGASQWEAGKWYHVAIVRDGNNYYIYRNGIRTGSNTNATAIPNFSASYVIGGEPSEGHYFNGYIDEYRISKGISRWTDEFTPPGRAYDKSHDYGVYTSEVLDLGTTNPTFNSFEWTEHGVRTGDGETDLTDNALVAHWKFNETSGTTVSDSSGNGHNGTATNMTTTGQDDSATSGWTADNRKWGAGSLMFDGSNDYVDLAKTTTVKNQSKVTIASWIKINSFDSYNTIFYESNNTSQYSRLNLTIETDGTVRMGGRDTDGTPSFKEFAKSAPGLVSIGKWYHVVGVFDADTDNHKVYLNGNDVTNSTTASATFPNTDPTDNIRLGATGSTYGDMIMDSTRMYFRVLDVNEINSLYQAGNVQLQTRTGTDSTPDDGSWEAWAPVSGSETQIEDYDNAYLYNSGATNLVSYWPMDETSGTNVDDPAGSNDGTATGTDVIDGKFSKARYFDGTSDEIVKTSPSSIPSGGSARTIEAWINLDNSNPGGVVVGYGDGSGGGQEYIVSVNYSGGSYYLFTDGVNVANNITISGSEIPTPGQWSHFVFTMDGSNNWKYYLNGVERKSGTFSVSINTASPTSLKIGNRTDMNAYFPGAIDEVKIYDTNISASTIYNNYLTGIEHLGISPCLIQDTDSNINIEGTNARKISTGAPKIDANTVGLWHLDETNGDLAGNDIYDSTTNNHDGEIYGTNLATGVADGFKGKARDFNGSDDYISIPDSDDWDLTSSDGTIEMWIKPDPPLSVQHLIGQVNNDQNWVVYTYTDGKIAIGKAGVNEIASSTGAVSAGVWQHIAITRSGSTTTIYVDGTSVASNTTAVWTNPSNPLRIGGSQYASTGYFYDGLIDEVVFTKGYAKSLDDINQSYRVGRDHRIHSTLDSAVNLNTNDLVPFYIASDQPGTHLEATFGESEFANGIPSVDTVGLWHLDEEAGSSAYLKDYSSFYNHLTPTNTTSQIGKQGRARNLDGNGDYLTATNSSSLNLSSADEFTVSAWIKITGNGSDGAGGTILGKYTGGSGYLFYHYNNSSGLYWQNNGSGFTSNYQLSQNKWHFVNYVRDASNQHFYVDGQPVASATNTTLSTSASDFYIGTYTSPGTQYFNGDIDEVRIDKIALTAEEIRQAYEIGNRTHPITIDFAASLDSGNLITGSGDTSFTIDATAKGFANKGSNLYVGDKIIVRENYDGTEYIAQGTVNSINTSTGAVTVASWDTGGTFPTSGYTANADVFKWQREYFDISDALPTHVDAVGNITLRVLDGDRGRTFWIDDLNMVDDYLTDPTGSTITSTSHQYFQYRIIETTTDTDPTPSVSSVTLDYSYSLTMTGGSTSQSYLNNANKTSFNTQCNGVTINQTGKTVYCEGSWNQSDWYTVGSAASPLSDVTIQGTPDVSSWNGYSADGNVTLYVRAKVDGNPTSTYSFTVDKDTANPQVSAITSVAGDTGSPYYDTTDDSSTTVIYTASGDATTCKWSETDITYTAMANTCSSTSSCDLDLSGLGSKTVYMACEDTAGNYTDQVNNYQLDYTIGGVSMTGAQSDDTSINNHNKTAYNIQCNGVTAPGSGTIRCYASFDQSDWHEVDNTTAPVSAVTLQNDMNVTGWTGYAPDGAKTIYTYATDGTNDSEKFNFASYVDTVYPVINSITSVAGDTTVPYEDATNNASTFVVFDASADSDQCKWSTTDQAYDSMTNSCGAAGNSCNLTLTGVQAHTAYIRCIDTHGNKQQSSLQVDYEIISEAPTSAGWKYYRDITLDTATTVPNQQIKVELIPGNFDYANAQDNGEDIRFYDEFGSTKYDYWIQTWNTAGTSKVWVEIPDIGTTKFLMEYHNESATSESDFDATFTKDYTAGNEGLLGVWHMDEREWNSCSGSEDVCDSSGNGNHAVNNNSSIVNWRYTDGGQWDGRSDIKFADGGYMNHFFNDSSRTYNYIPENDEFDLTQAITLEAWVNLNQGSNFGVGGDRIITKAHTACGGIYEMFGLTIDSNINPVMNIGNVGSATSSDKIYNETWNHIVGTYDNATDEIKIYLNGELKGTTTVTGDNPITTNDTPVTFGGMYYDYPTFQGCVENWNGAIDETRIYSRAITAGEVLAHYERRNAPTGAMPVATVGGVRTDTIDENSQENWYDNNWGYRTELSVINEGNDSTLTDYQVQFNIDTKIYIDQSQMQTDGDDIRFTDSDGTTLTPYYIISGINTNNTRIYVKIPSIPANNNKTIYMYYGNSSATADENFDNTFTKNPNIEGVVASYHFDEGSSGTCSDGKDVCDSYGTTNGTFESAPVWQGAEGARWEDRNDLNFSTGDHLYFDGVDDAVNLGTNIPALRKPNGQLTLSAWIKPTSDAQAMPIIAQPFDSNPDYNINLYLTDQKKLALIYNGYSAFGAAQQTKISDVTITPDVWSHVAIVLNNLSLKLYLNGELAQVMDVPVYNYLRYYSGETSYIGTNGNGAFFKGYIEQVDWHASLLNDSQIRALYERRRGAEVEPQAGYFLPGYIEKGGDIYTQTWEAGTTIQITDPVIVLPGETLTIEPGTIIKFAPDTYISANGATIVAEGTAGNYIYFTSMDDNSMGLTINDSDGVPTAGDYHGIYVYGANSSGSFKFCDFNYGGDEVEIDGTTFKGMLNTKNVNITAYNNIFNNSANSDIFVFSAAPIIERNNLGDSPYGLWIDADNSVVATPVQYNSFENTTSAGVFVDNLPDTDNNGGPGLVLRNNDFNNTNTGFYIQNPSGTAVRDSNAENTVDARQNAFENIVGTMCYYDVSAGDCKFDRTSGGEILFDTNSAIVSSPNGGESYFASSSTNITWSFNNGTSNGDHVDIWMSSDSGAEFDQTIVAGLKCDGSGAGSGCTGNSGTYSWTIPAISTTEARIKVVMEDSSGDSLVEDISDQNFSITVMQDQLSDYRPDQDAIHTVKFVVGQNRGTYTDDSIKITFANEFDLSLTADNVSASGGDVSWSTSEIIGTSTIVFPFTGTLDDNDGLITLTIGDSSDSVNNPEDTGSYRINLSIHDGQSGSGIATERMGTNILIDDGLAFAINVESALQFAIRDAGDTQDITELQFGDVEVNTVYDKGHILKVSTNAYHGYTVTVHEETDLTGTNSSIPDFVGTNYEPLAWASPPGGGVNGYYGYHTSDSSLGTGTTTRFANPNTWASVTSSPQEVAFNDTLVVDDTTTMTYRLQVTSSQDSGSYSHTVLYVCTPKY